MKLHAIIKILIFLTMLLFAYSLWQRTPDVDDAWIGEHAYWMAKDGFVRSELMHGITGQEVRHIVHHKVFTLTGAMFILVFGFSLITIKSVSLLWLGLFLLIFISYVSKTLGKETAWTALLLTMVNALVFQYSFVYRPEIMVMTLGFVSYLFLEKAIHHHPDNKSLIISGLFAGIAASTHLNGLIFMAAGGILLLWKSNFRASLIFSLSTLPAFGLYFYDFNQTYGISYWLYQINDSPALHKSSILPSSLAFAGKIFREHLRFFHSPKEITLSLLFLFTLIVNYKRLREDGIILKYLALLIISLSLLSVHTTSKYLLLYLPFMMLIILRTFQHFSINRLSESYIIKGLPASRAYKLTLLLTGFFIVANSASNASIAARKFDPDENHQITRKYIGSNTGSMRIIAPMTFIFNEIDHYKRIQSDLGIIEMQKSGRYLYGNRLLHHADSLQLDYLIISDEFIDRLGLAGIRAEELSKYGYVLKGHEPGLTIIGKRQPLAYEQD